MHQIQIRSPPIGTNLLCTFIGSLNSRQEIHPLVGKYIDSAKADPLHLKNNICQGIFVDIWKSLYTMLPDLVYTSYADVLEDNIFRKFVDYVKVDMHLNQLSSKMVAWFNESKNK